MAHSGRMQKTIDPRAPAANPMNLTCTTNQTSGAADTPTTTYTIQVQEGVPPNQPITAPQGSTTILAANGEVTYTFTQVLPNGQKVDLPVNGAGVLVYSTP